MTRIVRNFAAVALCLIGLIVSAEANSLRGRVMGQIGGGMNPALVPRNGVPVLLARVVPGGLVASGQVTTAGGGFYFFFGVAPGSYVLVVNRRQYPVQVTATQSQDIAPIVTN